MSNLIENDEIIEQVIATHYQNSVDVFYTEQGISKHNSFKLEVLLKNFTGMFCPYDDIYNARWTLYTLSNGGFYYKPIVNDEQKKYKFNVNTNYFEGELNAEEIGLVVSLFAINHLCNLLCEDYWIKVYYWLKDFAIEHPSSVTILRAID